MAMRRQPFSQRLGDLADIFLKQHLQQQNQDYENTLLSKRQSALSEQNNTQEILRKALADPKFASQLSHANPNFQAGGLSIGSFAPSQGDAVNGVGATLAGIDNPEKVPTDADLNAMVRNAPGGDAMGPPDIQALIEQRNAKNTALLNAITNKTKAAAKPEQMQSIGEGDAGPFQQTQFVNPFDQLGKPPVQSGLARDQQKQPNPQGITIDLPGVGNSLPATRHPDTGAIMYRGQDVTTRPGSDKPWATVHETPLFTPIQTGDTYAAFNRRGTTATPVTTGPNSPPLPAPTTTATRTMKEGAGMMNRIIPTISQDAETLDKIGLFGPVMSRIRDAATKLGTVQMLSSPDLDQQQAALISFGNAISTDPALAADRLSGKFATELGLLASGAGRVHGGARGGGSIQMIDYLKGLLSASGTLPMFQGRLDALSTYMNDYAQGPPIAGQTPQTPAPQAGPPKMSAEDLIKKYGRPR